MSSSHHLQDQDLSKSGDLSVNPLSIESNQDSINSQELPSQVHSDQTPSIELELCDENKEQVGKWKLTSVVWNHFKKQRIDGVQKAICIYCEKKLGGESKNGTKNLHDHFHRCPHRKQRDIRQAILNPKKEASGKLSLGTYTFDQDNARKELASMIVLHEYPLSMVDHVGFRNYSNTLQPLFKMVSRNTVKNDIMKIYDYEKSKIMDLLGSNKSRIAITTDMWTSSQKKGFMVITSHFIDDAWTLQSRVIRFIYVPCPHTSESLSKALTDCLFDWNLNRKLSTLTVDNCTTNDGLINILLGKLSGSSLILNGEFFHMRCCAHILNLIVKEGLEVIKESIEKIRDSVAFWSATPKRLKKFVESARQLNIFCDKKLALDCKTRWNSTFLMLSTAMKYKDVFPRLSHREPQYKCVPTDLDWNLAKEICERLEFFYEVTEIFSGTKYLTTNLYFPNICEIKLSMFNWIGSPYVEIRLMATHMIDKFNKYWSEVHHLLVVAIVLDPRFKMKLVEFYFPRIFGNEDANHEIENVRHICYKLVDEYKKKHDLDENVSQSSASSFQYEMSSGVGKKVGLKDRLASFDAFVCSTTNVNSVRSEIDTYLKEPVLPRSNDFDLLMWWKANSSKYPILQTIARDVLTILISTVASESAFSTSGRFISPHRSSLHPKTLEALMCTQDWLCAEMHGSSSVSPYKRCAIYVDEDIDNEDEVSSSIQSCTNTYRDE